MLNELPIANGDKSRIYIYIYIHIIYITINNYIYTISEGFVSDPTSDVDLIRPTI